MTREPEKKVGKKLVFLAEKEQKIGGLERCICMQV
jgi:hypothetical protein